MRLSHPPRTTRAKTSRVLAVILMLSFASASAMLAQTPASPSVALRATVAPRPLPANVLRARQLVADGKSKAAVALLDSAIAHGANDAVTQYWLAVATGQVAASSGFIRRIPLAWRMRRALERAVELDPHDLVARAELSRYLVTAPRLLGGDPARAESIALAMRDENRCTADVLLGWAAHHDGRQLASEQWLRSAVTACPDSAPPYFALAHLLSDQERNDESFAMYARGFARDSTNRDALYAMGRIGAATGTHLPEATAALRRMIADRRPVTDSSELARAHLRLGQVYAKSGLGDLARKELLTAKRMRASSEEIDKTLAILR
jgi:tetratricopeptide (TPR) repeat protein